ncbi:o-succinylbenzoate synthase [Puteibacter caeruleilacunae]|nr:o-succinylbenzoate synthase [Puteibacter caeruleilacunae]
MLKAKFRKYTLKFKQPAGTSRGIYKTRDSWFIFLWDSGAPDVMGIGECAPLPSLSCDDVPNYEEILDDVCQTVVKHKYWITEGLVDYPSIRFGLETAKLDLRNKGSKLFFDNEFSNGDKGIPINGLIWMGEIDFMKQQIQQKLKAGFDCIKIKIGAIDFDEELELIREIRKEYGPDKLELRVDANGAFDLDTVKEKLNQLSELNIHSIEQPIKAGQVEVMADLCADTPIPIALDEELIGVNTIEDKKKLLETIHPDFIILKPSLHGGRRGCEEWIRIAGTHGIGWWITSALESNIGLNAIAQWTQSFYPRLKQGLGTGQLYENNFESPLEIRKGELFYNINRPWNLTRLLNE